MSRGRGVTAKRASVVVASGLMLDTTPQPLGAYSLRQISSAYVANKAVQVTRASDSTTTDIGFDGSGNFDTTALNTFCTGTTGYISKWYDQSGHGNDLIQAAQANMYRIYSSGAVEKQNNLPAARATDTVRGMVTGAFSAYTGPDVSAALVGTISSGTASFSPRYVTLLPTGLNDIDQQGAELIRREGSSTPLEQWSINRNNASPSEATVGGVFAQLQQVVAIVQASSYTLSVDGTPASGTATLSAFNFTRIGLGYSGSAYISAADQFVSEFIVWPSAISSSIQGGVSSNQSTYYSTAGAGLGTAPNYMLDNSAIPATAAAYSTRLLTGSYAGKCIQVTRDSDNTTSDIGFDAATHALDKAALKTFCGSANGYVSKWYDQSGNGHDLAQTTVANMFRIYVGATQLTELQNSVPALHSLDEARGLATAAFSAYTGASVSGSVVGAMPNTATAFSPRYLSLIPTGFTDINAGGAYLIARHGATPDQTWGTNRNSVWETATGTYNTLQLVTAVITDPSSYAISVDGNNATTIANAQGNFNFTQIGVGFAGGTTYQSAQDQYITEVLVFESALTSTQRTAMEANQRAWFNTATPTGGGGGGGTGPDQDVAVSATPYQTLVFQDDFTQGFAHNWNGVNVTSGVNPADWGEYGPGPGNEGVGTRTPANIIVQNGEADLQMWSSLNTCSGMSNSQHQFSYGRWSMKFKQDKGVGAGPALLLWTTGTWPNDGEIDICESPEGTCIKLHTTVHIGATNRQTGVTITTDLTQWHVLTCVWNPSFIDFYLDGSRYFHLTDTSFIPSKKMWLGIQNDEGASGHFIQPPNSSTPQPVTLHIDWVKLYQ